VNPPGDVVFSVFPADLSFLVAMTLIERYRPVTRLRCAQQLTHPVLDRVSLNAPDGEPVALLLARRGATRQEFDERTNRCVAAGRW